MERLAGAPHGVLVPSFDQAGSLTALWPLVVAHLQDVWDERRFRDGRKVREFERALAGYTGARHAIATHSGTEALVLLLRAAGLRPGDEVVVPAFGQVSTAGAVLLAGGRPVFADVDQDRRTLDAAAVAAVLTPRTRFLLPTHLGHQMPDMDALGKLAALHGLTVVEDARAALGVRWDGVHAGLLGVGGALSFAPSRTLGALGQAGAVLTSDRSLATDVLALRDDPARAGAAGGMDDVQAAVLFAKLGRIDADIARRAAHAARYRRRLAGLRGVHLPADAPLAGVTSAVAASFVVEVEHRDAVVRLLVARGIDVDAARGRQASHLLPCFAAASRGRGALPVAEAVARSAIDLPLYPDLTDHQIDAVCDALRAAVAEVSCAERR